MYVSLIEWLTQDFESNNLMRLSISSKGHEAIIRLRWSQWLLSHNMKKLAILAKNKNIKQTGCDIDPHARIGKGLQIGHPVGIVVSGKAILGENVMIQGGVTIGTKNHRLWDANVTIGNNVEIGTGAKILGDITIGDDSQIGANSVVLKNVPPRSVAVGVPARILGAPNG